MDLQNYILILGKTYLWTCRCKETKPSFSHFKRILLNKYQTERHISLKSNKTNSFRKNGECLRKRFFKNQVHGYVKLRTICKL